MGSFGCLLSGFVIREGASRIGVRYQGCCASFYLLRGPSSLRLTFFLFSFSRG